MTVESYHPDKVYLEISNAAADHLKSWVQKQNPEGYLLIGTTTTGCSGYAYDIQVIDKLTDHAILAGNFNGLIVYVDKLSIPVINHLKIDYEISELNLKRLVYKNPNETARCGCGESFSVKGV